MPRARRLPSTSDEPAPIASRTRSAIRRASLYAGRTPPSTGRSQASSSASTSSATVTSATTSPFQPRSPSARGIALEVQLTVSTQENGDLEVNGPELRIPPRRRRRAVRPTIVMGRRSTATTGSTRSTGSDTRRVRVRVQMETRDENSEPAGDSENQENRSQSGGSNAARRLVLVSGLRALGSESGQSNSSQPPEGFRRSFYLALRALFRSMTGRELDPASAVALEYQLGDTQENDLPRLFGDFMMRIVTDSDFLRNRLPAPRLSEEEIEALPKININHEQTSQGLRCSVCLVDFKLRENVCQLVCSHLFHVLCIRTWLMQSGTCPNCRRHLREGGAGNEGEEAAQEEDMDVPVSLDELLGD